MLSAIFTNSELPPASKSAPISQCRFMISRSPEREHIWLQENCIGHTDFTHIMQRRGATNQSDLLIGQTNSLRQQRTHHSNALRVLTGVIVVMFGSFGQT